MNFFEEVLPKKISNLELNASLRSSMRNSLIRFMIAQALTMFNDDRAYINETSDNISYSFRAFIHDKADIINKV